MTKVRTPEPEGFADFWAIWQPYMRHTDGRGDARERYRKQVLAGADPEDIILGAKTYIEHLKRQPADERKFIPLAASWLNKEAYMDWADRARTLQRQIAERQQREAQPNNVTPIRREEQKPDIEERARHAQSILARAGFAAASGE